MTGRVSAVPCIKLLPSWPITISFDNPLSLFLTASFPFPPCARQSEHLLCF